MGPYTLSKKSYGDYSLGGGTKVILAPGLNQDKDNFQFSKIFIFMIIVTCPDSLSLHRQPHTITAT